MATAPESAPFSAMPLFAALFQHGAKTSIGHFDVKRWGELDSRRPPLHRLLILKSKLLNKTFACRKGQLPLLHEGLQVQHRLCVRLLDHILLGCKYVVH